MMKIVVLDGYVLNPGDLSWSNLASLGELIVYDRTKPGEVIERIAYEEEEKEYLLKLDKEEEIGWRLTLANENNGNTRWRNVIKAKVLMLGKMWNKYKS